MFMRCLPPHASVGLPVQRSLHPLDGRGSSLNRLPQWQSLPFSVAKYLYGASGVRWVGTVQKLHISLVYTSKIGSMAILKVSQLTLCSSPGSSSYCGQRRDRREVVSRDLRDCHYQNILNTRSQENRSTVAICQSQQTAQSSV